jgi:DNA-binding NarL/FixJ family response regulator
MSDVDTRFAPWLDIVGDLLNRPLTVFPRNLLLTAFDAAFDAEPSWNWVNADGDFAFELLRPVPNWPRPGELEAWRSDGLRRHPLIKWFAATGQTQALTIKRVPLSVATADDRAALCAQMRPVGLDEQLSVPYRVAPGGTHAFVLARTGEDFSDADVDLARRLQPLLALLDRQVAVLHRAAEGVAVVRVAGLTGRELAVLQLLTEGYTATSIGFRLGASPRTIRKHLEHIYRKLAVRDRLTAIRVAESCGLTGGVSV